MKKLGQHFLKNKAVLDVIVEALELGAHDRIIEIGPGHGELTTPLLRASEKMGGKIISIEKDHALIDELDVLAQKEGNARFEIVEGDALKLLPEIIAGQNKKNDLGGDALEIAGEYKIVGNIPYYITGKLLRTISELGTKPEITVIMIQKEVAERICATPPQMNRLAASVQFWADAKIIAQVPKKDFTPPPEVDSAVILLKTKISFGKMMSGAGMRGATIDPERYYKAVRGIFAQPRKNLINNLASMAGKDLSKTKIMEFLRILDIDPESRPQNLSIEQIIAIALGKLWG